MEFSNVFYFSVINYIGGIESWYYYISKLYGQYDITLLYRTGNEAQINRLKNRIRCIKWNLGDHIKCKRLFINFDTVIMDYCEAESVVFVCHGDYKAMMEWGHTKAVHLVNIANDPRVTEVLACSKTAQESFYEITGRMPKLCYNPVALDEPKRLIRLCSAQRMTAEKGKNRIKKLARALDDYCMKTGNRYEWDIFSNDAHELKHPSIIYKSPRIDINRYFGAYDWFVALSDAEGYCYSVVEALCRKCPVVITPVPVFREIGCNERNSITLQFDCSNAADVAAQIFEKHPKFSYTPKKSDLEKYLIEAPSKYIDDRQTVRCVALYRDIELNRVVKVGEVFTTSRERAIYLQNLNLVVEGE